MDDGRSGLPHARARQKAGTGRQHMHPRAAAWRKLAILLVLASVAVACAGGDTTASTAGEDTSESGGSQGDVRPDSGGSQGDVRPVIRYAAAPDPLFLYLKDTGELALWEERHNLRIVATESWDPLTYFEGGHGDVVTLASYEMPLIEQEADTNVVAFGKYNHQHVPMLRNSNDRFETLEDVPEGATVCANSGVSNTIAWSIVADQLHGIDYRLGEGRFNMVLQEHHAMPALVQSEECTIATAIPEAAAPQLRKGELEMMYDGRAPWKIYQQDICRCDHKGMMSKLFVAREEWYEAHPEQAAAFLELWERGLQLWQENKQEIVSLYPDFFTVEAEEDTEYLVDFMRDENDWFADTVYMDQAWIDGEKKLYDYMIESGWMQEDAEPPTFEVVAPPA